MLKYRVLGLERKVNLQTTETRMLRMLCGKTVRDGLSNEQFVKLGVWRK